MYSLSHTCTYIHMYIYYTANVTTPYYGEVRLRPLNPSTPKRGVVELYSNTEWAPVCNSENTAAQVANVTCKQLGYTGYLNYR